TTADRGSNARRISQPSAFRKRYTRYCFRPAAVEQVPPPTIIRPMRMTIPTEFQSPWETVENPVVVTALTVSKTATRNDFPAVEYWLHVVMSHTKVIDTTSVTASSRSSPLR